MTDNPNVSPYVAEALKRAQLPISVRFYPDDQRCDDWYSLETSEGAEGCDRMWYYCKLERTVAKLYIIERTRLLREQQQVK